ncbi:hypothetical protein D3C81_1613690 [compost metagenome]
MSIDTLFVVSVVEAVSLMDNEAVFSGAVSAELLVPWELEPDVQPESSRTNASVALPIHLMVYCERGDAFLMNNNIPSFY